MKIGLNSLSCLLKNNLIVILFALLVGILSVLPNFLAVEAIKPDYNGIPFLYTNNEDYYLARINELKDGHFLVSSPYFYEYKDSSPIIPPVGEYLYYFLSKISFLSLPNTIVLAKFLFPFFLFLLIYKLTLELLPGDTPYKKLISIGTALLVTLGYDLVDYRFVLARLKGAPFDALSVWTRPVNPITGALFLFSLFLLTLKIIKGGISRFAPVAAGVIFSLTIGYIFSFGIAFAVLSILFLTYLVKKNFSLAKKIALIIAVGFGLDLVYWLTILKTLSGGGMELALRNGMILSHLPIFNKFLFAGIILFFLIAIYLKTKKYVLANENWFLFSLAMLAGSLIALNQQILTGKTIWPYHFVQYTIPIIIIVSLVSLATLLRNKPNFLAFLGGIIIIIVIPFAAWNANSYKYEIDDFRKIQKYEKVFSWLGSNAPKDCVVFVKEEKESLSRFIPSFTQCDVYFSTYLSNSIPRERVFHNYLMKMRLNDVKPKEAYVYLDQNEVDARENFYIDWPMMFSPNRDPRIEPILKEIEISYKDIYKNDFHAELKKYRLDFIITKNTADSALKKLLPTTEKVFETDAFKIYKI